MKDEELRARRAELVAAVKAARQWGGAVTARLEEIRGICRALGEPEWTFA